MVHGKNRIPYRIDRRLTGLADLNMMPLSRSGCSLSLKTHNMGNPGYNRELVDAAGSIVAKAIPRLSTCNDPSLHLEALPRRRETGDNEHSIRLRESLYSILENRSVVPDQEGSLRGILEVHYPPEHLTSSALQRWAECTTRPRNWLHHSALAPNRQASTRTYC